MNADSEVKTDARRLRVDGVDVDLGGVRILRGVTFDVRPGEVFGIVGPNGAGKTTILNVIDGIVRPSAGTVRYGDVDLCRVRPHDMRKHGIGRSLQSTHYFRDLTALQLVALGELPNSIVGALRFAGHRKRRKAQAEARDKGMEALRQFGLEQYANRPLSELSSAVQKLVDIARAVVTGGELLLLDEPTSGVSGHERGGIGEALRRLRTLGRTIVLIDHDPGFVTGNCDRLMAMNFGEVLDVGLPDEVMSSEAVKRSYLGESANTDVGIERDL
ncbi:branched-chain amino acid transport system ATP-binding protein [Thermomonospora echinospora]|uniref:Branched-chain amino acid transport system ATP-binding protein n=1 Tax=Thermomonospora echinospora TaxID=1992 RepID=A0A1H6E5B1_9ACTN|nr:ATP-binding cassette domain-containing protein [Thermomonospora echinospora]SEG92948.1 branched-chain amino acid transport system ATP-binding protein [Thermomonospora echinospora]